MGWGYFTFEKGPPWEKDHGVKYSLSVLDGTINYY